MAKVQSAKGEIFVDFAAKMGGNLRVMVTGDPDKALNSLGEPLNTVQKGIAQSGNDAGTVERIAE